MQTLKGKMVYRKVKLISRRKYCGFFAANWICLVVITNSLTFNPDLIFGHNEYLKNKISVRRIRTTNNFSTSSEGIIDFLRTLTPNSFSSDPNLFSAIRYFLEYGEINVQIAAIKALEGVNNPQSKEILIQAAYRDSDAVVLAQIASQLEKRIYQDSGDVDGEVIKALLFLSLRNVSGYNALWKHWDDLDVQWELAKLSLSATSLDLQVRANYILTYALNNEEINQMQLKNIRNRFDIRQRLREATIKSENLDIKTQAYILLINTSSSTQEINTLNAELLKLFLAPEPKYNTTAALVWIHTPLRIPIDELLPIALDKERAIQQRHWAILLLAKAAYDTRKALDKGSDAPWPDLPSWFKDKLTSAIISEGNPFLITALKSAYRFNYPHSLEGVRVPPVEFDSALKYYKLFDLEHHSFAYFRKYHMSRIEFFDFELIRLILQSLEFKLTAWPSREQLPLLFNGEYEVGVCWDVKENAAFIGRGYRRSPNEVLGPLRHSQVSIDIHSHVLPQVVGTRSLLTSLSRNDEIYAKTHPDAILGYLPNSKEIVFFGHIPSKGIKKSNPYLLSEVPLELITSSGRKP